MPEGKISPALAARLGDRNGDEPFGVILSLDVLPRRDRPAVSREQRAAAVAATAQRAAPVLAAIDAALAAHGGRRRADRVSLLGTVPVETTVAGIYALADLDGVRAILEDQPLHKLAPA